MFLRYLTIGLFTFLPLFLQAETIQTVHSFALIGQPKYPDNFTHFDYVNPSAPKGGKITYSRIGTYDNFNRFASRGNPDYATDTLYDALFRSSDDEVGSYYPLIASSARHSSDYRWAEVTINPKARFHDGTPITAEDVEFTFEKFMTEGVPQARSYYAGIKVKALENGLARFEFPTSDKSKMLDLICGLPILSKKFWQNRNFSEPLNIPPLSSGPYRISDYKLGQYVVYERVKDYWAADLPANKGLNNFDTIRYDYYLDDNVALEAFKAGAFDLRQEGSARNWMTKYQGKYFDQGKIIKDDIIDDETPQQTTWLSFNIQKPIFSDPRVREALVYALDFEWLNKALFYNSYKRTRSYFQNTEYEASSLPDAKELAILTPLKDQIPPQVFDQIYSPPITDGSGFSRDNLLKARELLKQAGWIIKDQQLVNQQTGQPFQFELMLRSGGNYQYAFIFQHNLKRLGIQMNLREIDSTQYIKRLRDRDYDMTPKAYPAFAYPDTNLEIYWATKYIDSTYNSPGVQDPAIDNLIEQISKSQEKPEQLLFLGRALDRVLTWNYLMIPLWYSNHTYIAYWNKFSKPSKKPIYSLGLNSWWFDENKATSLSTSNHQE